nr:MAG TPA: hypothetical protein [Caudoviricetes sp.]
MKRHEKAPDFVKSRGLFLISLLICIYFFFWINRWNFVEDEYNRKANNSSDTDGNRCSVVSEHSQVVCDVTEEKNKNGTNNLPQSALIEFLLDDGLLHINAMVHLFFRHYQDAVGSARQRLLIRIKIFRRWQWSTEAAFFLKCHHRGENRISFLLWEFLEDGIHVCRDGILHLNDFLVFILHKAAFFDC